MRIEDITATWKYDLLIDYFKIARGCDYSKGTMRNQDIKLFNLPKYKGEKRERYIALLVKMCQIEEIELEFIKAGKQLPKSPIIAITAYNRKRQKLEAQKKEVPVT